LSIRVGTYLPYELPCRVHRSIAPHGRDKVTNSDWSAFSYKRVVMVPVEVWNAAQIPGFNCGFSPQTAAANAISSKNRSIEWSKRRSSPRCESP
jgi:hypothetical protein